MAIVRKETLNFADIKNNNNKFYTLEIVEDGDGYVLNLSWGRVGTSAQSSSKKFDDLVTVEKEFEKKKTSKEKKGYVRLLMADDEYSAAVVDDSLVGEGSLVTKSDVEVSKEVLELIEKLMKYSKTFVRDNVKTPIGKLSKSQVDLGRASLIEIKGAIESGFVVDDLYELTNQFYRLIPVVFNQAGGKSDLLIDSLNKVDMYSNLLDVMESLVTAKPENDIVDQYLNLGVKMNYLDKSDPEYCRLSDLVASTRGSNHHFDVNVTNIYEVESMSHPQEFNPRDVKTMELYHGSRSENIIHVLQKGLRIKPSGAVHTGSMFGDGIYFASNSTKSANYCWGFGRREMSKTYYLFVCEVATGRIKDYTYSKSHLKSAPWGYNSVRGVAGPSLLNDEYIVYRESQVRIKYVIEFTSR